MSKDVNRDSVKLRINNRSNSQDNISKNDNVSARTTKNNSFNADKKSYIDSSHKRLNRLRLAIGSGHFRINPTRVAEKFIQFERQLSF